MNPPPDPLDPLLDHWGRPPPTPPLAADVWQRIAELEAVHPVTGWRQAFWAAFQRPSFAVAFVAACMLLGMFLAELRVSRLHHERDVQLLQSYLRLIDPLVGDPAAPAKDART